MHKLSFNQVILSLILVFLTTVTFFPVLQNDFTNWDDDQMIVNNYMIRSLTWKNLGLIFTNSFANTYVPLTILTFAIQYQLHGLDPMPYHLINLIFHIFNIILVFILFMRLCHDYRIAFIVSVFFAVHPLHVESVAWITERKDMLYSFFYLLALISYTQYLDKKCRLNYWISFGFYIVSALAKPMAMTLPFILLLVECFKKIKIDIKSVKEKIPFWLVSAGIIIANILAQKTMKNEVILYIKHVFVGTYNLLFYQFKLLVPFRLSCLYPYPAGWDKGLPLMLVLSIIPAAVLLVLLYCRRKSLPRIFFGGCFFLITIMPVIQFIPLLGPAMAADRYTYIPSLGVFYVISIGCIALQDQILKKARLGQRIIQGILLIAILGLAFMSYNRNKVWKNSFTLWNDVILKYPGVSIPYNNRGQAYYEIGKYEKAMSDFNQAITLDTNNAEAYNNRGNLFFIMNEFEIAMDNYNRALELKLDLAPLYSNRAAIYFSWQHYDSALANIEQALILDPYYPGAYNNRGTIYFELGYVEKAIANYEQAIYIDPMNSEAFYNLGTTYYRLGNLARAIENYNTAIAINKDYVVAYLNRGAAYQMIGDNHKALADYSKTIALDPWEIVTYNNRAQVYYDLKDYKAAWRDLKRAREGGYPVDIGFYEELERLTGNE